MPTTLNFKDVLDQMAWRAAAVPAAAPVAGTCMTWDARNSTRNIPFNYLLQNATTFAAYSPVHDEWMPLASPALTGTFGAGAAAVMHPTQGPRGMITTGATTTSVVLSTPLPAAVAISQLANRGDGVGFTIRIIGLAAGKTEERIIVANTAGTTPTITLDAALTFTPASGDLYEIRSGRVYLLSAGTLAAGMWKFYDIATNFFSGNLATANLPATVAGDSSLVALSEGLVPSDAVDSTVGFLGAITSTAGNTTTTLNGTAMPATLQANEYRNFQVRVVSDSTTPAAVGQRRRITSHTAGATGIFTVPTWTTTPSAAATFVVENDDDKILLFTNQANVYNYNITANTWDTSTWAAPVAGGAGNVAVQSHGIVRDVTGNARHSFIYRLRGGAGAQIDVLDIAGAATGSWSNDIVYGNRSQTFTTGTAGAYDPITKSGRYLYLNVNGTSRHVRFDVRNRVMEPFTIQPFPPGAATVGGKLAMSWLFDGATKVGVLSELLPSLALQSQIVLER